MRRLISFTALPHGWVNVMKTNHPEHRYAYTLWAPISQQRGYCEACRLTGRGVITGNAEGGSAG